MPLLQRQLITYWAVQLSKCMANRQTEVFIPFYSLPERLYLDGVPKYKKGIPTGMSPVVGHQDDQKAEVHGIHEERSLFSFKKRRPLAAESVPLDIKLA